MIYHVMQVDLFQVDIEPCMTWQDGVAWVGHMNQKLENKVICRKDFIATGQQFSLEIVNPVQINDLEEVAQFILR